MKIETTHDGKKDEYTLKMKLDGDELNEFENWVDIRNADDFFMSDLAIETFWNEWRNVIDHNKTAFITDNTAYIYYYMFDNYGYDCFQELLNGKEIELVSYKEKVKIDEYGEYVLID